jgi:uncharacterized Zn-finger protein
VTTIDSHTNLFTAQGHRLAPLSTNVAEIPAMVSAANPTSGYLKFRNDRGAPEICIGVKEFKCIGESPPQDHPHVYINMGAADTILCPYCGTRFRFDPRLKPFDADPPDSLFAD